jgi:indole-3-glycerol phosphate synthase
MTEELNKKSEEDLANLDLSNLTEQNLFRGNLNAQAVVAEKLDFSLYEKDFVAWSDEQALLLEQQRYKNWI